MRVWPRLQPGGNRPTVRRMRVHNQRPRRRAPNNEASTRSAQYPNPTNNVRTL